MLHTKPSPSRCTGWLLRHGRQYSSEAVSSRPYGAGTSGSSSSTPGAGGQHVTHRSIPASFHRSTPPQTVHGVLGVPCVPSDAMSGTSGTSCATEPTEPTEPSFLLFTSRACMVCSLPKEGSVRFRWFRGVSGLSSGVLVRSPTPRYHVPLLVKRSKPRSVRALPHARWLS